MLVKAGRPHAVVIGSGFGGLAAAVRLGARGYRVTVLEKLDAPGGRAYVYRQDGFTFDAGPTIITAPFLFEELWRCAAAGWPTMCELRPVSPFYRIRFHDGTVFDYTGDPDAMRAEVARLLARRRRRLRAVHAGQRGDLPRRLRATRPRAVRRPGPTWRGSCRTCSAWRATAASTAWSPAIGTRGCASCFSFHPLLIGGNPFSASSIYSLIAFLERNWGVHFAMGGTGRLVQGLVGLIEGQGGEVRCDAEVGEITWSAAPRPACGWLPARRSAADIVVSNADSAWTYRYLLPRTRAAAGPTSGSSGRAIR